MHTYLITALSLNAFAVLLGLVQIAKRTLPEQLTPTLLAVKTFARLVFCGWAIYLLAQGVANV